MSYCFGIDIGGTTVKCGLFTTEGVLLEKWEIKTRTEENGKAILPDVAETILKKMEEKGIEKTSYWCGRRCSGTGCKRKRSTGGS